MNDWRDAHFAHVIEHEVMRKRERALIVIGGAHISSKVMFPNSLIHLLDSRFPGQTWVAGVLDLERVESETRSRLRAGTAPAGAIVFFFSSRRRHTRWTGDWSSDVCSSD